MNELLRPMGQQEPARRGYHLREADFLFEIKAIGRVTAAGDLDSIDVLVGTDRLSDPTLAKRSIAVDAQ
jgi:hypothetical protein